MTGPCFGEPQIDSPTCGIGLLGVNCERPLIVGAGLESTRPLESSESPLMGLARRRRRQGCCGKCFVRERLQIASAMFEPTARAAQMSKRRRKSSGRAWVGQDEAIELGGGRPSGGLASLES